MTDPDNLVQQLEALRLDFEKVRTRLHLQACSREAAEAEAKFFSRKRSDSHERDMRLRRQGSAIDIAGGLAIDDRFLIGCLISPHSLTWLVEAALARLRYRTADVDLSLTSLLHDVLADDLKRQHLTRMGAWARLRWYQATLKSTLREFASSAGAADDTAWRRKKPTLSQLHVIAEMSRDLAVADPALVLPAIDERGAAHDFIKDVIDRICDSDFELPDREFY